MLFLIEPPILSRRITDAGDMDQLAPGKPSEDDESVWGALAAETVTPSVSAPDGNSTVAPAVFETFIMCSWSSEDTVKLSHTMTPIILVSLAASILG